MMKWLEESNHQYVENHCYLLSEDEHGQIVSTLTKGLVNGVPW